MIRRATVATVLALCGPAAADDGLYFSESFGVGLARGDLRPFTNAHVGHVNVGFSLGSSF